MKRPKLYELSYYWYNVKELNLYIWRHDSSGHEVCDEKILKCTKEDKYATRYLIEYEDCEVLLIEPTKRNTLRIIAIDSSYKNSPDE